MSMKLDVPYLGIALSVLAGIAIAGVVVVALYAFTR
jgi:hypothetical protein